MKKFCFLLVFIVVSQLLAAQECDGISGDVTPATSTICQGNSVQLTATGGSSYEWRLNDVLIDGETGSTLNATQEGTYSVTIIEGNCAVPASNTATVTVTPTPSGTISPANASFCQGGSTTLTASGGTSYTWFRNGNEINGETGATLEVNRNGTYTVTIHQGDCSADASNSSVVTQNSAPSGNISPANTSICPGGSAVLTATGGTSYIWFRNGNEINGETGSTITVTQGGTYTATIKQGTCSGPASNSSVVTVTSTPTGGISPANTSICQGGSTVLTASGGSSYTWFRNGTEITNETDATLTVTQAGNYTVTIHQGDCDGAGSNSSVVTIASAPTGEISPAAANICQGSSVELTATGGTSYTWFRNGNEISNETGATITVSQVGTYSVTIHQGDCSAQAGNTAVVTRAAAPSGDIEPALASICPGGSQVLTATGGTSYTWFLNGNEITGETGGTLTVSQPGIYSATIHQGQCSGPASNTSIVSIAPLPVGTISPGTGSICEGGSLTLTATGGTSYTWFRNGDEISGQTSSTLNVTEEGTYFVIIRQGTCSGPALNTAIITKTTAPSGAISPTSGSICQGGSLTLTATGGSSYIWFRDGNVINGQTGSTINVTQAGTYTATIKQGTCTAPASTSSVVSIASAPTGEISPASASICEGGAVTLTATGGSSYLWFRDGQAIVGQTGATLNVTQAGTYTATIHQGECNGPASNSSVVSVGTAPTGTITPANAVLCGGGSQVLTATGGTSYVWSKDGEVIAGEQSATLNVTESGTYSVIIMSGSCTGPASNTSTVTIEESNGTRYPDVNTRPGAVTQLTARDIGVTYEWTPSTDLNNPTSRTPTVTTSSQREYTVRITSTGGCVITDTVLVKVNSLIFIPTAFTPNRNGTNDVLRPMGELQSIESFKIYNRWGQLMFQTKEIGAGWDGKYKGANQPSDTYTWLLTGVAADGKPLKLSGKTLLIR
jgi:gliding motility-associated-like protein